MVWALPRPSAAHLGGDTAFAVPVLLGSGFPGVGQVQSEGETATRAFAALQSHPIPITQVYGGFSRRALNHVAYFLMFDPERGRASDSGRALSLSDMASGNRLSAAFGIPFDHEFTHAFAQLNDEYLDHARSAPSFYDEASNVVPTNTCEELPWRHLLVGGEINPDVDELVGAFGAEGLGYHPEFLCLLNGVHDNADFYGGDGRLRSDRLCNFCREITAFRVFERTGVIPADDALGTWAARYRRPFYDRFGFMVPPVVPQTNNLRDPAAGQAFYEACVPASP